MAPSRRQPIKDAPRDSRERLGMLLLARRQDDLGYRGRPGFEKATGINRRMSSDIEMARRDNFDINTLRDIAAAYRVTYESLLAVAYGDADELTPAVSANAPPAAAGTVPPPRILPPAPPSGLIRDEAVYPYAIPLWMRILDLVDQGVTDPDGARLGLGPDDAKVWDGTRGMSLADRAWTVGEVQRRRDARNADGRAGASA